MSTPVGRSRSQACWNCRQRRLACDCSWPACNKCTGAGVQCSGYSSSKPVQWRFKNGLQPRHFKTKTARISQHTEPDSFLPTISLFRLNGPQLQTETIEVVEAIMYMSDVVHPLIFCGQPGPSPVAPPIQQLPTGDFDQHMAVIKAIYHRASHAPELLSSQSAVRDHLLYRRQKIVQSLRKRVSCGAVDVTDETIFDIWSMALLEYANTFDSTWRTHARAFLTIVDLHGGFGRLIETSNDQRLFAAFMWGIFGASVTPTSRMMTIFSSPETVTWFSKLCEDPCASLCYIPLPLIAIVIQVNLLRRQLADKLPLYDESKDSILNILSEVKDFPVDDWIDARGCWKEEWSIIIGSSHAAVALYALNALTRRDSLPLASWIQSFRTLYHRKLFDLLEKASLIPMLRLSCAWPSYVAGLEAQTKRERRFIEGYLALDKDNASGMWVLETIKKSWVKGKTEWDDCLDSDDPFW